ANVTVSNVTANNKVYDTTTNASISGKTVTVALGNSSAANGSTVNNTTMNVTTVTGTFANASAGNQTVNLNATLSDTTNYTLVSAQNTTTANIAKANVTMGVISVSDKVYDGTTNAALGAGSATVQLGNSSAADGSLASASNFTNVNVTGGFVTASAGSNKSVNLTVALADTTNYSLSGGTQINTTANIAKA
ncbi:YDG domain-containing protein, partial [Herbaspirillum rubrisubalbicans]|uniref:YDG domain-containing protein n=1 Tax=Herbaspirillum rubrisubalbicans TaxID=80842 RepID=UPI0020D17722